MSVRGMLDEVDGVVIVVFGQRTEDERVVPVVVEVVEELVRVKEVVFPGVCLEYSLTHAFN